MVEILEIGIEDAFWMVFVAILSMTSINHIRVLEDVIPNVASESCYVILSNKGLWAKHAHEPMILSLAYFERFDLKATLTGDYVLIEVAGFSVTYGLPFVTENTTLVPRNYRVSWNGTRVLVRI